jgi:hypothetical protein
MLTIEESPPESQEYQNDCENVTDIKLFVREYYIEERQRHQIVCENVITSKRGRDIKLFVRECYISKTGSRDIKLFM